MEVENIFQKNFEAQISKVEQESWFGNKKIGKHIKSGSFYSSLKEKTCGVLYHFNELFLSKREESRRFLRRNDEIQRKRALRSRSKNKKKFFL